MVRSRRCRATDNLRRWSTIGLTLPGRVRVACAHADGSLGTPSLRRQLSSTMHVSGCSAAGSVSPLALRIYRSQAAPAPIDCLVLTAEPISIQILDEVATLTSKHKPVHGVAIS